MFIKKYWLPLTVLIVAIVGVGLYLKTTQPPPEPVIIYKPVEPLEKPPETPKETEAPIGDTSQGGHFHADGTWHEGAHEPVEPQPTAEVSEPEPLPAYIYDPDAKERPAGWDPELVFHTGDKKIDLNYRPLTAEEQAEYEHLKATLVPPEDYGVTEAGLIITAISNIKEKHRPALMKSLEADMLSGKSREYRLKRIRDFYEFFAD